ncbi:MAG: UDP-glucose 4-epimerase GalE [Hyphomicrobiales bacterium]|nr:UDP-glucose 4-epimerase GalE [Hyphomicrobiales bacterium]
MVTGGAGYIGSHAVLALREAGFGVVVLDNLSTGRRALVPDGVPLVEDDVGRPGAAEAVLRDHGVSAVLHFAGSIVVPESVADPLKYYGNNTCASRTLIEACVAAGVNRFIFSSTAAVYGDAETLPVVEDTPQLPINPYGTSKLMTEWMLRDTAAASDLRYCALRYFNVAGADPQGRTGQATPDATHLIKVACEVATGKRDHMMIFGDDYDTPDGTCVRDYIHVTDLADAHVAALRYLEGGGDSVIANCGYGHGFSVRQVLDAVGRQAGAPLDARMAPRRAGDAPALMSDSTRARQVFGWTPRHDDLDLICKTALAWERMQDARIG